MIEPLRVGVAGLGTVGASVVRILARQDNALAERCGRPIARHRRLGARPVARPRRRPLAAMPGSTIRSRWPRSRRGRLRRRADRRRRRAGQGRPSRRRSRPASTSSPPTRRCSPSTASRSRRAAEAKGVALAFEASVGRRHPGRQDAARGAAGNAVSRIYGILNGTCNYILSRMEQRGPDLRRVPRGRAAPRLRRGRPDLRRRGLRHRPQARDPDQPRLRHRDRRRGDLCRGHLVDRAARPQDGRRARLPHQAARRRRAHRRPASSSACTRPWCRRPRPIAQVMGVTNAVTIDADAVQRADPDRPRRRRRRHRLGRRRRHRRRRARARSRPPFGRPVDAAREGRARADAAPRGRLLRPPDGARPAGRRGRRRDPHGAKPTSRSRASCRSARTAPRPGPARPLRRAGARSSSSPTRRPRPRSAPRSTRSPATGSSPSRRRSSASSGNRLTAVLGADTIDPGSDSRPCRRASPSNRARSSSAS